MGLGQANLKLNQSFLQIYARRFILKTGIFVLRNIIASFVYHFSNSSCFVSLSFLKNFPYKCPLSYTFDSDDTLLLFTLYLERIC